MTRLGWSEEDADDFEDVVTEALAERLPRKRVDVFIAGMDSAAMAQRPWASEIAAAVRRKGVAKVLEEELKNRQPRVPVADGGKVVGSMPSEVGRRGRSTTGRVQHERGDLGELPFDDLREKRAEYARNRRALDVDIRGIDILLQLELQVPGAATPDDACQQMGTTVQEYLASDRDAS